MKTVYVFFVDGFEEIEGLTVVDLLRRAEIPVKMVSVGGTKEVTGSHDITVKMDMSLTDVTLDTASAFILPGGPGTGNLAKSESLMNLLEQANREKLLLGAICAAPSILGDRGMLIGKQAVCYPGFESRLKEAEVLNIPVVVAEHIVTSRGMGTAILFGLQLIEQLMGEAKANEIRSSIIYS